MRFRTPPRAALAILWLALGAACSGPDIEGHVRKGDEYVAQQMLREASIEYRNALQADPNRGDVRLKLGDLYVQQQDIRGALREYVRAADLLPSDVNAQIKAGGLLLRTGQFEDAKVRVQKALALDAKNVDAQVLLGNTLAGLKDLDGALAEYQEALALNPEKNEAYQNIGTVQMVRGRLPEAEAAFRKAVEVAPKSVPVRLALANFFWASGRRADAEQSLKETLALDPANLVANRALGVFYVASNQFAAAEPYFRTIAKTAKTDESLIGLADYYILGKRYDDAKPILRDLAGKKERYAQATLRLAAIDAALGNRVDAHVKVREVLVVDPANMAARLFSARLLLLEGKRDEALAMARTIAKDDPQSPESTGAFQLIGTLEAASDRPEEAIRAFQEVIKRAPKTFAAHLALARLYRVRGEWDTAVTHARAILTDVPKQPDARAELVRVWLGQGQPARAAEELASLRRDYPNAPGVMPLTAAQQLAAGQPDAARASYVKMRSANSGDLEALAGIVSIDIARGRTKDAVATVEESLKTVVPSAGLFIIAARAHLAAANPSRAEELLKKAIEVDPARLQAYSLLGVIYARQNLLGEAERTFAEIVKRNPSSVSGRTMLAMIYDSQRRLPEAEKAYKEVLELDPQAPVAANNLAWIYVSSGKNLTEALQLARTAHKYLPNEPNVNDTLGWIYYHERRFVDAIRHLETSVKSGTEDPSIHYHLGMAYANFGESAKARQALTRAVASNIEFDGKPDARKALAALN